MIIKGLQLLVPIEDLVFSGTIDRADYTIEVTVETFYVCF